MKKFIFVLILISIFGLVGWRIRKEREVLISRLSEPSLSTGSGPSPAAVPLRSDNTVSSPESVDYLKLQAMGILDREMIFKSDLLESVRKRALEKLVEASIRIRENYRDVPTWYSFASYRNIIGDYDSAIAAWNFINLINPNDFIAYHNLGDLYGFTLKNYSASEENFLKSIQNNMRNTEAYVQLATLYEYAYLNKFEEAEKILLFSLQSNPSNIRLRIVLAQYYERSNRIEEALKYFEDAHRLDPSNKSLQEEISRLRLL